MDESGYVLLVNILFKNELIFFGVCYSYSIYVYLNLPVINTAA